MILYNIRANGPFEYDKFILNIGQLHNEFGITKEMYENSGLKEKNNILSEYINNFVRPKEKYSNYIYGNWQEWNADKDSDSWLNTLAVLKKAVLL